MFIIIYLSTCIFKYDLILRYLMKTKTTITLSVDGDLKVKAMRIVQKGNLSLSAKFNDFLREFVSKYDSNLKLIPLE